METLYASHHGFAREHKAAPYKTTVLVLSSPSANSSSSSDSQDDLLPELWLESPKMTNYSYLNAPALSKITPPARQYGVHGSYFAEYDHADNFHASCLLRDESLEYAQSLLPNSLLFPLTGLSDTTATVPMPNTDLYISPVETPKTVVEPETHECCAPVVAEIHRPSSLRRSSSSSSGKSRQGSASSGGSGCMGKGQCKNLNTQLYKTELCASFMKLGTCPYGGKCQFAHGEAELKSIDRPLNWRSKPCANWARTGSCRYGKRCCFKHGN